MWVCTSYLRIPTKHYQIMFMYNTSRKLSDIVLKMVVNKDWNNKNQTFSIFGDYCLHIIPNHYVFISRCFFYSALKCEFNHKDVCACIDHVSLRIYNLLLAFIQKYIFSKHNQPVCRLGLKKQFIFVKIIFSNVTI